MEKEQIVWNIVNKMRSGNKSYDLNSFIDFSESEGIDVTIDLLRDADRGLGVRGGGYFPPEFVLNFITSYLKNIDVDKILDPWVKVGSVLIPLTEKLKPDLSVGFIHDKTNITVINRLQKNLDIKWEIDDPNTVLDKNSKFDVIVSFPLWSPKKDRLNFNLNDGENILIFDNVEHLEMLKSLIFLKEGGTGFFILSKRFLSFRNKKNNVFANLKKFGIYIDAVLEIPNGSFSNTGVPGDLVIFKKEEPSNLFAAELSSETSYNKSLLNNLKSRKRGKIPQLGIIQDLNDYKSLNYFINENEIIKMAKMSGLSEIPILDILVDANLAKNGKDFDETPNSVYLPIIGESDTVTSIDKLKIKPQNYIQLILDENKANAEFVSTLYNTKLGRKIRKSLTSGVTIPKINKTNLLKSNCYITDIETQIETIAVDSMLNEIFTQLDLYKKDLWKWPKSNKRVRKSIELLNVGQTFDYWLQSLPYPLSSILSTCKADRNIEHKVTHLLDFFEAYSVFNATIMLSSISANKEFFDSYFSHCIKTEDEKNNWICKASFTNWNILGACLAKKTRQLLADKESKDLCLKLFGNPTKEFMNLITSAEVYNILREVEEYRNLWKGHGAIVNQEEYQKRFDILKGYLSKIRSRISFVYDDVSLILPSLMDFDEEIYNTRCKEIKGFLPFEDKEVETITPLVKNKLYIIHENQYEPVKLLPLIRIMPGPKTDNNACYFYNRYDTKENKARFLSYHFEDEAEVNLYDDDVKSVFSILMPHH
ncbi:N-6 DNA methylase [Methanobacterium congolense]|uniref:N-6 DNA methylase n=1 Tax=Methanobacterium congolense TaxID=118062 RepID=UPI0009035756|nr:N-6 DNA methylase [Methanobacterium congolense]